MSLVRTTLSAAVESGDQSVVLASIAGLVVGSLVRVDAEEMRVSSVPTAATLPVGVRRGQGGTAAAAHVSGAGAVTGLPEDFSSSTGQSSSIAPGDAKRREVASYSAAGAIALPGAGRDALAVINGAAALAMTLAAPSKANEGDILHIVGNGAAAHTVTVSGGLGGGGATLDLLTFAAGARQGLSLIAVNETWVPLQSILGGAGVAAVTITAS